MHPCQRGLFLIQLRTHIFPNMKALILAGGQATRLYPITHGLPKCLLSFGDKTILDIQIDALIKTDVSDIIIITGYCHEAIEKHVHTYHPDKNISLIFNKEYETTRAAYGFGLARAHFDTSIIYLNSDLLGERQIIDEIVNSPHDSVTAIAQNEWDEEEVNVITNSQGIVQSIGKLIKREESNGEFLGATKLSPDFLQKMMVEIDRLNKENDKKHFAADAINGAIRAGGILHTHDVSHYKAIEIDTIEDYESAKDVWSSIK